MIFSEFLMKIAAFFSDGTCFKRRTFFGSSHGPSMIVITLVFSVSIQWSIPFANVHPVNHWQFVAGWFLKQLDVLTYTEWVDFRYRVYPVAPKILGSPWRVNPNKSHEFPWRRMVPWFFAWKTCARQRCLALRSLALAATGQGEFVAWLMDHQESMAIENSLNGLIGGSHNSWVMKGILN